MSWVHLREKTVHARKKHVCYLCGGEIPAGGRHVVSEGVWEGEGFLRSRMHVLCLSKTIGWDEGDWDAHDPYEFRRHELGIKEAK